MRRNIVDIADFHAALGRGEDVRGAVRLAPTAEISAAEGRVVTFVFSDATVDRYGDTIDQRGWVLDKFRSNPVVLFGHDDKTAANVVGKAANVRVEGNQLMGDIEFAPATVNPQAEVVYQLVKGGYLNSVSVGFQPIDWALSKDKSRPGGVDFKKQELLEISIVPIPANANALVQAKAAGIDVDRVAMLLNARPAAKMQAKGLYEVSWLACLLMDLAWLEEMVEWEAEYEGDGSPVPMMLTDAVNQLGQTLVSMTVEEVTELLAEEGQEKRFSGLLKKALKVRAAPFDPAEMAAGERVLTDAQVQRAGKTISSATEAEIRAVHDLLSQGCERLMRMVAPAEDAEEEEPESEDENEDQAKAKAIAEALRLSAA